MRIRRKKWAEDELKKSVIYINKDTETKGKWKEIFKVNSDIRKVNEEKDNFEIHIEIGMGKGKYISSLSHIETNPNIYYVGSDMIEAMLGLAKREIENTFLNISKKERESIVLRRDRQLYK